MTTIAPPLRLHTWQTVRSTAAAEQGEQQATYRRRTRHAVVAESALLLVLSVSVIATAAGTGADRADVLGFSFGYAQAAIMAGFAVTSLLALRRVRALSRVSITKAVVFAVMVEFFGASHSVGPWATGFAGLFLLAIVSLAGMSEFILINGNVFGTEPSSVPYAPDGSVPDDPVRPSPVTALLERGPR